ncbi:MAG: hypothetical protein HY231_24860 [Acidobacteria bacterium]|nr:hypothetical protein [Acidobacteriota bacterium]
MFKELLSISFPSLTKTRSIKLTVVVFLLLAAFATLYMPRWQSTQVAAATSPTIMFVTQPPFAYDFTSYNAVFGNHLGNTGQGPRGGDLYIRYGDGTLRNLTAEAGYGLSTGQEIAVREPSVHWSGNKALFSMVIGGTTKNNYAPVYWQIYEVSGLAQGQAVQITKLQQLANYNNVSPFYGTDDSILFTSDRPRNGSALLYPQLDEYESAPTVTGIWKMNPDGSNLRLLDHTVSGAFTPIIDSFGRIIYTRWDHLQRDQQSNDGALTGYGAFNYASETSTQNTGSSTEVFPEPRTQPSGSYVNGHTMNEFFPWMMNEDGTGLETINHVGRHELLSYFNSSHQGLPEFINTTGRRTTRDLMLQLKEDPARPGYYYCTAAPEFATHAAGQILGLNAPEGFNPDNMQVDYITDPNTANPLDEGQAPPANYAGHFRNPTPLSDGTLIAVQTTSPYADKTTGNKDQLNARYDFRLVTLQTGATYRTPGSRLIPNGIVKSITYWDNYSYQQLRYSGQMWELDPVEVRARPRPALHSSPLPAIEAQILQQELGGQAGVDAFQQWLVTNNLALVVSRNVTRRADKQQDFNLRIAGGGVSTVTPGATPVDVAFMQFLQGDLIRGYSQYHSGRRPIAQPMHDGNNPAVANAPPGSVALGADGSMAALVPARRALTWQMTTTSGNPVVRERYWLTFAPGEMRTCTNCHGINTTDAVLNQPPPTNPPQALRDLARWYVSSTGTTCAPAPASTSQAFAASGGVSSVNVNAGAGCAWTAASNASWLTLTAGASGSGSGTVFYSVGVNLTLTQRTGTLTIAGQTFTVTQAAATPNCAYAIAPAASQIGASGGNGSVAVTTANGCAWTATSNASWLAISAGASGNGNGTVNFSAAANPGSAARTGTLTIAGQTYTVTQERATSNCVYAITPLDSVFKPRGGNGTVNVSTTNGCAWTATSNVSWITISTGASGTGSNALTYTVARNTGAVRRGTLTIAGQTFSVKQKGV